MWFVVRAVHVLAGVGWLGEVLTINFVLLPALFKARADERATLLTTVFPYVFRLATVLGGLAGVSGLALLLATTQFHPALLLGSRSGRLILIGGVLGALLYAFHLFQESGAERSLAGALVFTTDQDNPHAVESLLRHLALFPRVGLLLLLIVAGLMLAAVHLP